MKITLPELSLVVLIGPSGSGKSTFARRFFKPTEILSSDYCRGLVADDENDQSATTEAFEVLHFIARKRLEAGRLTVIDATNVQKEARKPLVELARAYHVLPVAIVLNLPEHICLERSQQRPDRQFGPHVVRNQAMDLRRSLRGLEREGFRHVFVLNSLEEVEAVEAIERQLLWNNRKTEHGPFDIIGDIHGCFEELVELLTKLGYQMDLTRFSATHPENRKVVFLGDLVDRGPRTPDVLRLVKHMVEQGTALCVPGNHDMKLMRKLRGRQVQVSHGLAESLAQLEKESQAFESEIADFIDGLVSHYVLDDGKLVVAHAGLKAELQGRGSGRVRDFALYGETTGETDEFGLPIRYNWAAEYRGRAMVVYGHTPVVEPEWLNNTICVDTGCVYGGKLTALRYPERELVSVQAHKVYYESPKPLAPPTKADPTDKGLSAQQEYDDVLDIEDVLGKRQIATRFNQTIIIREENAIAALEVMSRFAADPKWLIYLPPTMSPSETSQKPDLLEHPAEAFAYYRQQGVAQVVCEEKHMGSRAVVIVGRDEAAIRRRFGITENTLGSCYTRTGRRFFDDLNLEARFLARVKDALEKSGFWEKFQTDWVCLDCELMPWSAKAQELLRRQYAAVGSAASAALIQVMSSLEQAASFHPEEIEPLLIRYNERQAAVNGYIEAYRHYCWPVNSVDDLKLAPFHLLATEGATYYANHYNHAWHMETLAKICQADPTSLLMATPFKVIDVNNEASQASGISWWEELTKQGGEGMVVKPLDFTMRGKHGLVQPAIKCRGPEYLRIIYGPEYRLPENLERLRSRGLAAKRSLALREFVLGMEALSRFVEREPLRRVHKCVFGVLALESEPVDPRL